MSGMNNYVIGLAAGLRHEDPSVRVQSLSAFGNFILHIDVHNCLCENFRRALDTIKDPLKSALLEHAGDQALAETAAISLAVVTNPDGYYFKYGIDEKISQARADLKSIFDAHNAENPGDALDPAIYEFSALAPGYGEESSRTVYTAVDSAGGVIIGRVDYIP